jgi:hypothetical protein
MIEPDEDRLVSELKDALSAGFGRFAYIPGAPLMMVLTIPGFS